MLSSLFLSSSPLVCFFPFLFVMVFAKQEAQFTNPDAQIGDCILPHFPFLTLNFPFFIFNFGMNFFFYSNFFSVFFAGVVAGREGQITNPDAQIGAHYHSQPPLKQPGENKKIFSRIVSALLRFWTKSLAIVLIYDHIWKSNSCSTYFQELVCFKVFMLCECQLLSSYFPYINSPEVAETWKTYCNWLYSDSISLCQYYSCCVKRNCMTLQEERKCMFWLWY